MKPHLFTQGDFTLHSGDKATWKIECDALTDEDWDTIALMISERGKFGKVHGVPRGGLKLAEKLEKYCTKDWNTVLIVDDVLTTGASMDEMHKKLCSQGVEWGNIEGYVVFSRRRRVPYWITPLFTFIG